MEIGELLFIGFCSLAVINALFFAGYIWFKRDRNIYPGILLSPFSFIATYFITHMFMNVLQDDFDLSINLRTPFFFIPAFPLIDPFLHLISNQYHYPDETEKRDNPLRPIPRACVNRE